MSIEARNASAKSLQKLYNNRATDNNDTDYVIQSKDGKEIKVHSYILKSR